MYSSSEVQTFEQYAKRLPSTVLVEVLRAFFYPRRYKRRHRVWVIYWTGHAELHVSWQKGDKRPPYR